MAERIGKNLWRLDIPLVGNPLKNLNSYLLTGPRSLLIDTGFRQGPCRAAMERQLEEIGVDRDRLDIFLTHLHSDHTGLAPELIRPGCRVYIGRVDGTRLTVRRAAGEPFLRSMCGTGFLRRRWSGSGIQILRKWRHRRPGMDIPSWRTGMY